MEVQTLVRAAGPGVSRDKQEAKRAAEAVWNLGTKVETLKTVAMVFGVFADVLSCLPD